MLEADERQEWRHQASNIAEMADILCRALKETAIPHALAEQMLLAWWTQTLTPKVEFPDLAGLFSSGDED